MVLTGQLFLKNSKVELTTHNGVLQIIINLEITLQRIYFGWLNNIFISLLPRILHNPYYIKMDILAHGILLIMKQLIISVGIKNIIIVTGTNQELNYSSLFKIFFIISIENIFILQMI